jgi:hypothetical protein
MLALLDTRAGVGLVEPAPDTKAADSVTSFRHPSVKSSGHGRTRISTGRLLSVTVHSALSLSSLIGQDEGGDLFGVPRSHAIPDEGFAAAG